RRPDFQPLEFLRQLREFTRAAGIALIFDEMITGFRVHLRGARGWSGVDPDLATYGKIVGGGLPIGIVAGRLECMGVIDGGAWDWGDRSSPRVPSTCFAGTFCKHPLAMAASRAVLLELRQQGPDLQARLNRMTAALSQRLNAVFEDRDVPVT